MNRKILALLAGTILLSACSFQVTTLSPTSTPSPLPVLPSDPPPVEPTEAVPQAKLPAASFDSRLYANEMAGFALDYPAGWIVQEAVVGSRATQVQFLSSPDLADAATLPDGATRMSATLYQWDPKNDLAAYVAHRKTAWDASGFRMVDEQNLTLELGLAAVQFVVETPETQTVFVFAALDDQYLELSGEGDLELVREIVERVRPFSGN